MSRSQVEQEGSNISCRSNGMYKRTELYEELTYLIVMSK